jgi:hypothetical protein
MRTRDAWLAAVAAALGVSDTACHRETKEEPAAARDLSARAAASSSVLAVAPALSTSASTIAVATSASASGVAGTATAPRTDPNALQAIDMNDPLRAALNGGNDAPIDLSSLAQTSCGVSNNTGELGLRPRGLGAAGSSSGTLVHAGPTAIITATATGTVAGDDARIAATKPRLRNCATRALDADPSMEGTAVFTVVVAPSGDVSSVTAANTGLSVSAVACMSSAFRGVNFATVASGHTLSVKIVQTRNAH